MDGVQTLFLGVAALALLSIVSIYYIWVRKRPEVSRQSAQQP